MDNTYLPKHFDGPAAVSVPTSISSMRSQIIDIKVMIATW